MMTVNEITAFTGALLLMVITPGQGVLACISRSLSSGFKMSVFVVFGIITGDTIFVLTALFGLAAVAQLMGELFVVVRYLGAIYLVWLGYCTWVSSGKSSASEHRPDASRRSFYLSGLCITLGNPKAIVFYLSCFPAFLDLGRVAAQDIVVTLAIVICVLTTVLLTYSFGASRFRMMFQSWRASRNIRRCSGGAMVAAGVTMALKQ